MINDNFPFFSQGAAKKEEICSTFYGTILSISYTEIKICSILSINDTKRIQLHMYRKSTK